MDQPNQSFFAFAPQQARVVLIDYALFKFPQSIIDSQSEDNYVEPSDTPSE